jgi:hypothetical protein
MNLPRRWVVVAAALGAGPACGDSDSGPATSGGGTAGTAQEGGAGAAGAAGAAGSAAGAAGAPDASCASEDDCFGATSHCDTAAGVCVGCSSDADCRGALKCDTATGVCRDCVTEAHCGGPRPICDAVSGQCTASCASTVDCLGTGGPMVCDTARGVCVDCIGSIGGCTCELVTYSCVGCLEDADCPPGEPFCGPSHECSAACSSDAECSGGLFCDLASERCVECAKNLSGRLHLRVSYRDAATCTSPFSRCSTKRSAAPSAPRWSFWTGFAQHGDSGRDRHLHK